MRVTLHDTTRLAFAENSLNGLSVGDALGAQYFVPGNRVVDLLAGTVPPPVWEWTDDTEMACSVVWMLREAGTIEPDTLAAVFAERCEPYRSYGWAPSSSCGRSARACPGRRRRPRRSTAKGRAATEPR